MFDGNQEQERLKRLRDQQLRARDPHVKQRKFQRRTAERERKRDNSYTLGDLWKDIPLMVRYLLGGFLLGGLVILILPLIWDSPWVKIVSFVAALAIIIFTGILGNAVTVRENLKDFTRK
ncbi:MAG: hypothetical protein ISR59_13135 [Anaerolineales bacterium]|uniref:Uncharacterized protein n=1 Tax=Candidatus Desulfolinea nitratireducens TaxID=2841698 RepID=A0A8J6NSI8_9CHLR|nr:hypothetical protein [Candidatus Desulfolinea nitratireducens]MBL6962045.1 hypothetical protein [Anaerolineales bacterium]